MTTSIIHTPEASIQILRPAPTETKKPLGHGVNLETSRFAAPTLPELPPLGHDLTYPRDSSEIKQLGISYNHVLSYAPKGKEEELVHKLRSFARLFKTTDTEALLCFLAFMRLTNSTEQAIIQTYHSLKASQKAEAASPQSQS